MSLSPRTALVVSFKNTKSQYPYHFAIFTCIYHHFPSVFALKITLISAGQKVALNALQIIFQRPELFHNWNGHSLYEYLKNSIHTPLHFKLKTSGYFQHVQLKHYIFPLADMTDMI